ncbi:MAG: hypothetical protein H7A25_10160 [Leptospiraceae bacterium]|nr:hypothetical protein [Leptospiraceae bacterium]
MKRFIVLFISILAFSYFFVLTAGDSHSLSNIFSELEKNLEQLENVLKQDKIDRKKLSEISTKISSLKTKMNHEIIRQKEEEESEYCKLIDIFITNMQNPSPGERRVDYNREEYNLLFEKLERNINKKKDRRFTKKYIKDVKGLMTRHRVDYANRIRLLHKLIEKWN